MEQDLFDRMSKLASIVEEYSAADLAFEDPVAADETLAKVAGIEEVHGVALYSSTGSVFASYRRGGGPGRPFPTRVDPATPRRVDTSSEPVVVYEPVIYRSQRYGTLYLEASTNGLRERARAYRRGLVVIAVTLLALYWLLAVALQRVVLRPLT